MRKKLFTFLLALAASVGLSWATDPIVIVTNTSQSSYTQGDITITCTKPGDSEGFYLDKYDNETATITNSGSSTISQIELGIGWFPDDRSYVRANGAEPTSSDPYSITFSNVNSNNVTLTITDNKIQISDVTITLADEGGSTPTEVDVVANEDPKATGVYYSTFYDSSNKYELPSGVEAFVADLSGSDLVLTKIAGAGQVIPADNAVILKANSDNITLTQTDDEAVSFSANNDLEGVDAVTTLASLSIDADECYVLSGTNTYGVGFYKIDGSSLKANKAYVIYDGEPSGAPRRLRFVFDQATSMENVQGDKVQSTKVVEDGVLYIINNGVKYNAQGQIVK